MQLICTFVLILKPFHKLEQSIMPRMGATVGLLGQVVENSIALSGISLSKLQFVILKNIAHNNGANQCNLAFLSGRDKTTFTRNIKTLERKQLVERKTSHVDRRVKEVYITPTGRQYLEMAEPIISNIVDEIESTITTEERQQFLNTLQKLQRKLTSLDKSLNNNI